MVLVALFGCEGQVTIQDVCAVLGALSEVIRM